MSKVLHYDTTNLGAGFLYFYVHFVTEVICFFMLGRYTGDFAHLWLFALVYDMLAFVPQAVIGYVSDKHQRIPFGLIGLFLLAAALCLNQLPVVPYISLVVLCLGNACTHVNGAEVTLSSSHGHLSHCAIFVSGGSFGVITGKLLSGTVLPFWILILLAATAVPFVIYAQYYLRRANAEYVSPCKAFSYQNKAVNGAVLILLVVFIIIVRGYMGYGIPTSWNKTVLQTVLLFCTMGVGKAMGGVLADLFGVRKIALLSASLALPFLMLGDQYIAVSLIGVMLFSMTMSITLALLVSVLPGTPGLAFGLTTIGLFLGTAPVFFFKFTTLISNCVMIAVLTALCLAVMLLVIRKDGKKHV